MSEIIKLAFIKKVKDQYCVFSHKKDKNGKRKNFGCYGTRAAAKKRLSQIWFFKKRGTLDSMVAAADELDRRGLIKTADAVMSCLEELVNDSLNESDNLISLGLGKLIASLETEGEEEVAERLEALLPDILKVESGLELETCPDISISIRGRTKSIRQMPADTLYAVANRFRQMYREGLIDEASFEYAKFKEFRSALKTGFLLPPPSELRALPKADNWWEYFEKLNES